MHMGENLVNYNQQYIGGNWGNFLTVSFFKGTYNISVTEYVSLKKLS